MAYCGSLSVRETLTAIEIMSTGFLSTNYTSLCVLRVFVANLLEQFLFLFRHQPKTFAVIFAEAVLINSVTVR